MLFSLNLLKKFVDIPDDISAEKIADLLTMKSMEIEGFKENYKYLENVYIGRVEKVEKHPNADKLFYAQVDIGEDKLLNIVCGGNNLVEGMKVAVAKIGAKVSWHGAEEVILERTTIRGVESEGMICAGSELALDKVFPSLDERNILDLSNYNFKIGEKLKDIFLKDIIFEVDNKSINHRPDLWGHYGIARELSVILNTDLKDYSNSYDSNLLNFDNLEKHINIEDKELSQHYLSIKINNLDNRESPLWLKDILASLNTSTHSALVDLTNYLMFEFGHPMHAFDANKIENNQIFIRYAKDAETFLALDEKKYVLNSDDIVISDEEQVLALAGIIGGLESSVSDTTKSVILEIAHFPAEKIRRSSMNHSIRTDASMRFEKSLDPQSVLYLAKRAVSLIKEIFPEAEIEWLDQYKNYNEELEEISIPLKEFKRLAGFDIEDNFIISTLSKLGFEISLENEILLVKVPSWRATKDIKMPIDLVEEVLRLYSYDNIPKILPKLEMQAVEQNKEYKYKQNIRNYFVDFARMTEVYNYSFIKLESIEKMNKNNFSDFIHLENPIDKTRPVLRDDLIYNLLENVSENQKYLKTFSIFEIARVFDKYIKGKYSVDINEGEFLPEQREKVSALIYSNDDKNTEILYDLKQYIKNLFKKFNKSYIIDIDNKISFLHPYQNLSFRTKIGGELEEVAYLGAIHPTILDNFAIKGKVAYASIDLEKFILAEEFELKYEKISKYPSIDLDISFLISKDIYWKEIYNFIIKYNDLIKAVDLLDVYNSEEWDSQNLHSLTLRIKYQSSDKTLEMDVLNNIHNELKKKLEIEFGLSYR